jgi:hypothetical protein
VRPPDERPDEGERLTVEERYARVRQARQVYSGAELTPPADPIGTPARFALGPRGEFNYLVALAILVVLSALIWAFWGVAAATLPLLVLIAGLLAAWFLL